MSNIFVEFADVLSNKKNYSENNSFFMSGNDIKITEIKETLYIIFDKKCVDDSVSSTKILNIS